MKRTLILVCFLAQSTFLFSQVSQRYELVKLGKNVNTANHEAAPVISPTGKDLYYFTVTTAGTQEIWVTHKDDKGWSDGKKMGSPLNNNSTNQVFTVFPDGSLLIRGGRGKDEVGFSFVSTGGSRTELKVEGFKDMMRGKFYGATMSSDKKHMILYFSEAPASPRSDLYISHQNPDGSYTKPVKLKITDGSDEFGPFLNPNDKTLYYASDRSDPNKQGGADIYKAERLDDTWNNWTKPVNLKRPINTAAADDYYTVDAQGNVYTSRANSRVDGGNLDLFVLVPKIVRINLNGIVYNEKTKAPISSSDVKITVDGIAPVSLKTPGNGKFDTKLPETDKYVINASASGYLPYNETFTLPLINADTTITVEVYLAPIAKPLVLSGTVYNKKTNQPINARIDMIVKPDRQNVIRVDANNGNYTHQVGAKGWYVMTATAEGFLNAADSLEIGADENVTQFSKDLYLQPIEVGLTFKLKNIYFDNDKTTLKPESFVELAKALDFLTANPKISVEIAGHTDSNGSDEHNATLSQGRSEAVVEWLISQGIDVSRLSAKGYGESKPIDTNATKEGQANNRRVEFTVLSTD
ncbi:MAG TPA: OmpA family protein [Cyclobacteriaceae bacterium]|nr:OmpA family protein [Cyclobacteriaceae bacterium]